MSCDISGHLCCSPPQPFLHGGSPAQAAGFSAPAASAQPLYPVVDHAGWQPAPVQPPDIDAIPAVPFRTKHLHTCTLYGQIHSESAFLYAEEIWFEIKR